MRVARWLGAGCALAALVAPLSAGSPAGKKSVQKVTVAQEELVALALRAEARGDSAARKELLDEALLAAPDDASARWQTGHVWHDGAWMKPDQIAVKLKDDLRLVEYRNIRGDYPATVAGQLALAQWCARKGLHDQQRAHLTQVLEINPNNVEARRELGFRWVDGVWLSAEERIASGMRAQQAEESLAVWSQKLTKLRETMDRRNQRQRELAIERLREIKDPLAIPALEAVFGAYSESTALVLVDVLACIDGTDAAVALSRQAVFSPSDIVRGEAAKKLHARPYEQFVPMLLSGMYTPVQTRMELYNLPDGRLLHRHAFYREGMDQAQLQVNENAFRWIVDSVRQPIWPGAVTSVEQYRSQSALLRRAARAESQAANQNTATALLNESICDALRLATNESAPSDPNAWWRWWADRNEVEYYDEKPVDYRYGYNEVVASRPLYAWEPIRPRTASCLVAGTPVWTETGARPVEKIQAGDCVLAQDTETGALSYKPVLRTTRRAPVDTLRIDAGPAGALTCSGGHLFSVSGKGWVRARVMEPGMLLHTLDGPQEVLAVQKAPQAEVFNLIVADFHSYFVADGRWLTHDNTPQKPTSAIVPGLVASR